MILCSLLQRTWSNFASRLFLSITAHEGANNLAIAPLAIQESLLLLYLGSDGEGASQLKKYLDLQGTSKIEALERFEKVPLSIITSDVKLETAFKFYVDTMFPISPRFQKDVKQYLHNNVESVKFDKAPELAQRITDNMESMLKHQMKNIIRSAEINTTTRSILLQGFHFHGNFKKPFRQMIRQRKFFTQPNISISVDTYIKYDKLPYAHLAHMNCYGIDIPYRNSKLSMLILLPNKGTTVRALETHLANTDLKSIVKHFNKSDVHIEVPHFSVDSERELTASLKRMGIKAIFDSPEFDSLTRTPFFSVTKIKHKGQFEFTCGVPVCMKTTFRTIAGTGI